jgi:hypothetical protein
VLEFGELIEYKVIKVLPDQKFRIDYTKSNSKIDVSFAPAPDSYALWMVAGTISPSIYSHLLLPTYRKSCGPQPPIITKRNFHEAQDYGVIRCIDTDHKGDPVFAFGGYLPAENVINFLNEVWQPPQKEAYSAINLGDFFRPTRYLPEKIDPDYTNKATLKVILL